jgi:hypothetical protein
MKNENKKPEWWEKLDEFENNSWHPEKQKTSTYVAAIIVNFIILFLINYIIPFNSIPFIKNSFFVVLWIWNITLLITIGVNFFLLFFRSKPFYLFTQIILNAASLVGSIVFLVIFPVDFGRIGVPWLNTLFVIGLYISIFIITIMMFVNFVKFLLSLIELERK